LTSVSLVNWADLFLHFTLLSFMSIGGAITTVSEMHRYLVAETGVITDAQFNASIAIGQASPGPNVLFVALLGWNVGYSTGNMVLAFAGVAVTMGGILLPCFGTTYLAAKWVQANRAMLWVRAFKLGLAPVVVALLLASAWTIALTNAEAGSGKLWIVTVVAGYLIWATNIHILWLLGAAGALGWHGFL